MATTQHERLVRIEHDDGRRYSVSEHDFSHKKMGALQGQTYADAGFKVVSYEDGTPFEDGQEPGKYGINTIARAPEIGSEAPVARGRRTRDNGDTTAPAVEPESPPAETPAE